MHAVLRGNACHCAMQMLFAFKRLNRFVRFPVGVVRSEIIDLTEYQDTATEVVMSGIPPSTPTGQRRRRPGHPGTLLCEPAPGPRPRDPCDACVAPCCRKLEWSTNIGATGPPEPGAIFRLG